MGRDKSVSYLSGSLTSLFFTLFLLQTCIGNKQEACVPSSCGKISNISYPFRLTHDPPNCGKPSYELACENITVLNLYSGRYYVESINYNKFTIRLVDPGIQQKNCSSIPRYYLYQANFSDSSFGSGSAASAYDGLYDYVIYLNCRNRVSDDPGYADTASCINWNSNGHIYAIAGDLPAHKLKVDCRVMMVAASSLQGPDIIVEVRNAAHTEQTGKKSNATRIVIRLSGLTANVVRHV
ncbi:hypothetical protein L6164_037508 [Bauhinia variegata]|uniref:Uncharacterized protein n=1 Tax=Bauhinia variegata TaxID=167791 RepID=A0ACB9KKA8_BAUVA|nr:hypothetical protein L6164_037508 [Bauhinia variegata]